MDYAISIKQPWATMVAHGLKTIEVRRWPTRRRGRVLIHTGRMHDTRAESWQSVPNNLSDCVNFRGGIIGEANLIDCRTYDNAQSFARDKKLHHNDPTWFRGPVMYGFVFANARPLPFHRCSGSLYFFEVTNDARGIARATTGLLVSVRNASEAAAALAGGADIIDVKEPRKGPLGRAGSEVIAQVIKEVNGRRLVSAALGELANLREPRIPEGLAFLKCGLAGMSRRSGWERRLLKLREQIAGVDQPPRLVTVAYADWNRAAAPPWQDVVKFALRQGGGELLFDTFDKLWVPSRGKHSATLLDSIGFAELRRVCQQCRDAGVRVALAGSLRLRQIVKLLEARPDWVAVRGAACEANKRDGEIHPLKVRDLAEVLRWTQQRKELESSQR